MSTPDKCQHCGADVAESHTTWVGYACGSMDGDDQDNYHRVLKQLTREREKWGKLRVWASDKFWLNRAIVIKEMNRLDAEAKEGR